MENAQKVSLESSKLEEVKIDEKPIQNPETEREIQIMLNKLANEKFEKELKKRLSIKKQSKKQKALQNLIRIEAEKRLEKLLSNTDFAANFENKLQQKSVIEKEKLKQKQIMDEDFKRRIDEQNKKNQENSRVLTWCVEQMQEYPIERNTPKEPPRPLLKVHFPEEGGVFSEMQGYKHPYRGFPYQDTVQLLDLMKKILKTTVLIVFSELKKQNKLKLLLGISVLSETARSMLYGFWMILRKYKSKENKYCQPVKELYRVFQIFIEKQKSTYKERTFEMLRDFSCIGLEYDNAYKFRFQDIALELNKEALKKNPIKELTRLIDIAIDRELPMNVITQPKEHWLRIRKFINSYYFKTLIIIKKGLWQEFIDFILELDLKEIKLSKEDKCYCENRKDYKFGYKFEREKKKLLKNKKIKHKRYEKKTHR